VHDIPIYYEEYGEGKPVISIHGWPVDHQTMKDPLEPIFCQVQGYRRIYLDLPGMGKTPSALWIKNSDDMLEIVIEFIKSVIGEESFLLIGESYGGYISQGLIHKMSEKINGVLLLCSMIDPREDDEKNLPERQIRYKPDQLDFIKESSKEYCYMDMAVIITPEAYDKWQNNIQPALDIADMDFLTNNCDMWYSTDFHKAVSETTFNKPSCILTGRQDSIVGYKIAYELVERFPRATFAVLDCAGHMLEIERETLFRQFVKDWIWRVELDLSTKF